jgi:hypothetical protein
VYEGDDLSAANDGESAEHEYQLLLCDCDTIQNFPFACPLPPCQSQICYLNCIFNIFITFSRDYNALRRNTRAPTVFDPSASPPREIATRGLRRCSAIVDGRRCNRYAALNDQFKFRYGGFCTRRCQSAAGAARAAERAADVQVAAEALTELLSTSSSTPQSVNSLMNNTPKSKQKKCGSYSALG